jgi:hypothetical protein
MTQDLAAIIRFFHRHRLRLRYVIIGAMALSVWGRPRTTLDLYFLVEVEDAN